MATVKPIDHVAILNQAAHFESQMVTAIRTTLKKIAASLDNDSSKITLDDLAIITPLWTAQVDNHLLKQIGQTFTDSANKTRLDQHHALVEILKSNTEALTAATVSPSEGEFEIPKVTNQRAIDLMTNARNRMVNVGNDVWEQARSSLVDGLKAGEGTDKLRDRITESANFSAPRAGVVARTEISHAMNQGTLQQMQQINAPTMTKEWIATDDNRTRPEHAAVNGEKVGINEVFSIGEEPGDAVNCRCTLGFDIPDDDFANSACDCDENETPSLSASALVAAVSDDLSSVCACASHDEYAAKSEFKSIKTQATEKISSAPVPSKEAIKKAQIELENARKGIGRAGGEARGGSAKDRRRQRYNLFKEFGGEKRGYVVCHDCGLKIHWADPGSADNPHGFARFERGKIFVKCQGGGYQLANLLPECFGCNRSRNDKMIRAENGC